MQIVIKHWTDEVLKTPAKPVNAPLIEKYTGVENYKAREDQIDAVMEYITVENYALMKSRLTGTSTDDSALGSTNVLRLIRCLENKESKWIKLINDKLE